MPAARMLCAAALGTALLSIQATAQTPPSAASEGAAASDKDERLPQTPADSDGVKLRMQPATESAVPIQDLGDRLVTTGSIAPVIKNAPATTAPDEEPLPAQTEPPPAAEPAPESLSPDTEGKNDAPPEATAAPPAEPAPGRPGRITASVKLRAKPDNAAAVVATVEANAAVAVLSCDCWCEVEAGDKRGFVFRKFVETGSDDRAAEKHETEQKNE